MAEDFLEEIYHEANLFTELLQIRDWAQKDVDELVIEAIKKIIPSLGELGRHYISRNPEAGVAFWKLLEKLSMYCGDNVWLVDFLDGELLPILDEYLSGYSKICVDDENGICLESTGHGFLTIKDTIRSKYFHSRIDPMREAREQVEGFYNPKVQTFALLGCGLGYLAYQLYRISEGAAKIHLFVCEERMILYGRQYGVLDWIPQECLEITVDKDILPFLLCAEKENHDFYIFRPEITFWSEKAQHIIKRLHANQCTSLVYRRQSEINFYRNIASSAKPVLEATFPWMGKSDQYVIVAGGPSVDENMDFLEKNKGKMPILVVGTVFKKLIQAGIRPDLVAVMDPSPITIEQFQGMEEETVPLMISTTTYWRCGALYKGEKYLAPALTGSCEPANVYAENVPGGGWECGGTVTIFLVRAALSFGAKEIYLVGADFAYPNGYTHADGAYRRIKKDLTKLMPVEDASGGIVYTDEIMNMYRQRMEELIEQERDVCFINLSKIGAKIKGCETQQRG